MTKRSYHVSSERTGKPKTDQPQRSRKGAAEPGIKDKFRGEAAKNRQKQRQHDADRPDRGGPQGRKDKDFQRKF
jgi:hypothetical protein